MKLLTSLSILVICAGCVAPHPAQLHPVNPSQLTADYGAYPANVRAIVERWIHETLFDPNSVIDLEISQPHKHYSRDSMFAGGQEYYGYMVTVSLNAKNRLGGYTGKHTYLLVIRNGSVIKQTEVGGAM